MGEAKYALGLDYGTNSVRALVVDIGNGQEIGTHIFNYEKGEHGIILDKKNNLLARQHPADYVKGMEVAARKALKQAETHKGFRRDQVIGIGVDTTGSTPIPVDQQGQPLAFHKEFKNEPNALAWLWKDHTGYAEAAEITELAKKRNEPYLAKCGGSYSSEWFFSKILHCRRVAPKVFQAAYSWVELADFVPGVLTGLQDPLTMKRGVCAAGHKAMFNPQWGGLPSREFLSALDPELGALRERLFSTTYTSDVKAGTITPRYAKMFGLRQDTAVSVGAFDAHMGAVGAGIKPGALVKIIGTSTCDTMVAPNMNRLGDIPGLCGIVDGSILPGYYGLEAGQSAVGDIFNWFVMHQSSLSHEALTKKAAKTKPGQNGLLALDWNNGNRTILVDAQLSGLLLGQTLHTTQDEIYRALIEATAYGARVIIDQFEKYGVKVNEIINCGGIAEKNSFLMQIYADVFGRPMRVSRSSQTCALGAALFGAVSAGPAKSGFQSVEQAQSAMCGLKKVSYAPKPENQKIYDRLFKLYRELHDAFGTPDFKGSLYHVMKDLLKIKNEVNQ